ncbi:hypothetical protein YC2023_057128 [Brassica napus]
MAENSVKSRIPMEEYTFWEKSENVWMAHVGYSTHGRGSYSTRSLRGHVLVTRHSNIILDVDYLFPIRNAQNERNSSDISVHHIPQRIHQLQEGISVRPITVCIRYLGHQKSPKRQSPNLHRLHLLRPPHKKNVHNQGKLLESRLTRNIQLNDPKYINGGDIYEFSGFFVLHNSRQRKLTQLTYYIQIDQETKMSKVTNIGPIFPIHNFSPQNYKSLLRLATTPTYLPGKSLSTILINKHELFFINQKQCANVVGQIRMMQKTNPYQPEVNTEVTVGLLLNM